MRALPYTTSTGLRIGSMYQHNVRPAHDSDALALQSALLLKRHQHRSQNAWLRILNTIWRWL